MTMKIAVLGATGFVGTTLVERLVQDDKYEVKSFARSTGNAWALTHQGIQPEFMDMTDPVQLRKALDGCTHIVNCARGSNTTMTKGIKALIGVCRDMNVERLIHLSSVLVYGDRPKPETAREDAAAPGSAGYGDAKLKQDQMMEAAAAKGLPGIVLCVPNISGPRSAYLPNVLATISNGSLPLVDGGSLPVDLADVRNIVHAIELALTCDRTDGKRIFITDGGEPTWKDLTDELSPAAPGHPPLDSITRDEALELTTVTGTKFGAAKTVAGQILKLGDVKQIVKDDEIVRKEFLKLRTRYGSLPGWLRKRIDRVATPSGGGGGGGGSHLRKYSSLMALHQLRGIRRSLDRAHEVLGYEPVHDLRSSTADYAKWYAELHGHTGPFKELYVELG